MIETTSFPEFETLDDVRTHTLGVLSSLLRGHEKVALFDVPTHENVGDNMIWEGEITYLSQLGKSIAYETDVFRHSARVFEHLAADAPILLHGGGNFGDIWPIFQDFREAIVQAYPGRKIIQLPQTVYFESSVRAHQADQVLSKHPDFTLLVRDADSYNRATTSLPNVRVQLCPDMALGWTPKARNVRKNKSSILVLARQDKEAAGDLASTLKARLSKSDEIRDWRLTGQRKILWKISRVPGRMQRIIPRVRDSKRVYKVVRAANSFNRHQNLRAGVSMMSGRTAIFTNRLHAHVLAGLLDIPHAVTENSYGKIGPIFRDYTHVFRSGEFLPHPADMEHSPILRQVQR